MFGEKAVTRGKKQEGEKKVGHPWYHYIKKLFNQEGIRRKCRDLGHERIDTERPRPRQEMI